MMEVRERLAIASDRLADDDMRIRMIKELLVEATEPEARALVSSALIEIVTDDEDDELVRQIASTELEFYPEPADDSSLLEVVLDAEEDLAIRVNLLAAFQRWRSPRLSELGSRLADGDELRRHVEIRAGGNSSTDHREQ